MPAVFIAIAKLERVPAPLLYAISRAEATYPKTHRIWPWTLNIEGKAYYMNSRKEAYRVIQKHLKKGITSIDIGPMQTNWYWHKRRYKSLWQALDPISNLRVGAKILRACYDKKKSWWICTSDYHSLSNTPARKKRANKYRKRIIKLISAQYKRT